MKLLIDENISCRIVKPLHEFYPDTIHENRTNLAQPSKDALIWEYAKKNNLSLLPMMKILLIY
jgi:predicted nuclease of predicted toxin-antitoxin system